MILIRLSGFIFLFSIVLLLPKEFTGTLYPEPYFIVFSCTHFVIGFIYSWKSFLQPQFPIKSVFFFVGLLASVYIANVYFDFLLMPTFLAHHILTESYVYGPRRRLQKKWDQLSLISIARILFEFAVIITLTYKNPKIGFTSEELSLSILAMTYLLYSILIFSKKELLEEKFYTMLILPTVSLFAALFANFSGFFPEGISGLFIIGYHGFVWIFIPLVNRQSKQGLNSIPVYLLLHICVIGLLSYWVYSYSPWEEYGKSFALTVFSFATFFHNFHSLMASKLNPRLVIRLAS
ncbi:MAG: hypothetical protein KDD61_04260 [Bdellovibrionales bacterium]|nr:hypothetical protein [Bdellovibrionales bacterium]